MATIITPTTQLEAVNAMLEAIGEAPVSTLQNPGLGDAAVANQTLLNVLRRVQTIGWSWNTDFNWAFTPDVNGNIFLPQNTLRADTVGKSKGIDVVLRGNQLYDKGLHTYTFTVSPIYLYVVQGLAFELLPESARQYIYLAAAAEFQAGVVGSETLAAFADKSAKAAWAILMDTEGVDGDYNMLDDSWAVARVLQR